MLEVRGNGKMPPFTVTVEEIDRAKADRYLSVGAYDKQRPISSAHVRNLIDQMQSGRFYPTGEVALAEVNGGFFDINGNHTLTAIRECGIPQMLVVRRYQCKNMKEVGQLYSSYDIGKARRPYDRLRALGITEAFPVNATRINGINAAIKFILNDLVVPQGGRFDTETGKRQMRVQKDAELWALGWSHYKKEIEQYSGIVAEAETRALAGCMSKAGIVAVALVTLESQASAPKFWERVAHDDGLRAGDPAHRLNKWLLSNRVAAKGKSGSWVIGTNARAAACCWNAFFDKREINVVRVPNFLSIKGTRWE